MYFKLKCLTTVYQPIKWLYDLIFAVYESFFRKNFAITNILLVAVGLRKWFVYYLFAQVMFLTFCSVLTLLKTVALLDLMGYGFRWNFFQLTLTSL